MMGSLRWLALAALVGGACAPAQDQEPPPGTPPAQTASADTTPASEPYVRPTAEGGELIQGDTVPGLPSWTRQDWEVLRGTVASARQNRIDTLPIGKRIARIGETFVGSPYLPQTLDPPGPERLIINLRAMDCVTFVENMLALAHYVREAPRDVLDRPEEAMRLYQGMIERVRYRDGRLGGYPSRLHYFTEWLADNERRGVLDLITDDLGGVVDPEPITFMSEHRTAYKQLGDDAAFREIGGIETELNKKARYYIPKERVASMMTRLEDGDILALTSTVKGLDVAHTGIAVWKDGAVHLLNAPLVGKSVEISEKNIADRLAGIRSQDGLMVGRPLERPLPAR
jgi:hypothetical protein